MRPAVKDWTDFGDHEGPSARGLGGTPWVDRNLRDSWSRIKRQVGGASMPRLEALEGGGFSVQELGCGHYGCVMPTGKDDTVVKLTSDPTEAAFIARAMQLPDYEGMVDYYGIYALADATHRNRPIFILWRQEAFDVGFLRNVGGFGAKSQMEKLGYDDYHARPMREGMDLLGRFMEAAKDVRDKLEKQARKRGATEGAARVALLVEVWSMYENNSDSEWKYMRGFERIAAGMRDCWGIAMEMANTDVVYPVGAALGDYLEEGILLADVHTGNIGRTADGRLIITDPGHAVEVSPRWAYPPEIEEI